MFDEFRGPAGIRLSSHIVAGRPTATIRGAVATTSYSCAYDQLAADGRGRAEVFAFYGVICGSILVDRDERGAIGARAAAFEPFCGLPVHPGDALQTLAAVYEDRLDRMGWTASERQQAAKGMATALLTLARETARAPTIHHIDPDPVLRSDRLPPLVDSIVFDIAAPLVSSTASLAATAQLPSHAAAATTSRSPSSIEEAIDEWIKGLAKSEQSRRGSAARLLAKTAGLSMHEPAARLAQLDAATALAYAKLSDAVGAKWGTVARRFDGSTADEIIAAATTPPQPDWARHALSPEGRAARLDHATDFLTFLRTPPTPVRDNSQSTR